jgi:hypothetical protein
MASTKPLRAFVYGSEDLPDLKRALAKYKDSPVEVYAVKFCRPTGTYADLILDLRESNIPYKEIKIESDAKLALEPESEKYLTQALKASLDKRHDLDRK